MSDRVHPPRGMKLNQRQRQQALVLPDVGPTPELSRKPEVQIVIERDPDGVRVGHYRVSDAVGRLLKAGLIADEWADAADRFRRDYHLAHFEPLSAIDLGKLPGKGPRDLVQDRVEDARSRVHQVMAFIGGINSPAGSALWFVVGGEGSVQQWAQRQGWGSGRPLRHEVATGILIASLGALAAYYARKPVVGQKSA